MENVADKFKEIHTKIRYMIGDVGRKLLRVSNPCGEQFLSGKGVECYKLPLDMHIEYMLTGWKGYDGIQIPRDESDENAIDIQRKLLAMDRIDGKIDTFTARQYDAELMKLDNILKSKVITDKFNRPEDIALIYRLIQEPKEDPAEYRIIRPF